MISIQKYIISEAFEQLSKSAKLTESKLVENDKLDVRKLTPKDVEEMRKSIRNPKGLSLQQIQNLQQTIREYNKLHDKQLKKDLDEVKFDESVKKTPILYVIKDKHGNQLSAPNSDDQELWDRVEAMQQRGRQGLKVVVYVPDKQAVDESLKESKLTERYSFPEVDGALYHFWNDLGKDPEVEDVIEFLEREYPDWVPTDPEDYDGWYHDVAGEISARLSESKLTEAPMDVKDYAAKLRARKAEKGQNPLEKINSQIDPDMPIMDQLQVYFDELVPASGPAKTVAGELVRAIMRILYRDYNDGDLWYTGYGKETCGDSVVYLVDHIKDLQELFEEMIYKEMEDAEYTDALEDVASRVMVYLNEHPELFTTPLDKDSRSGADLESYFELPTYEFEPDTSYDEDYYDVSWDDIDEYINDIVNADFRGATVNRWARDAWTIEGLDKEQLEYLEDVWEKWFNDFLSQYESEEPEEDYEDEDAMAEADWDDSTDSEFDESLNKDNQKRGRKMKIVAEDFQECNLNKMGTNEYEANTNRQKHIDMYRKFANLNDDEVITEDMINDYALDRTACICNREPERIKAEILGQRYSEYEQ